MNSVRHPDDRGGGLGNHLGLLRRGQTRVGQAQVGRADLFEASEVLGGRDHEEIEPALLDRLAIFDQPRTVGRSAGQCAQVSLDLSVTGDVLAPAVAKLLLERRHFRIGVDLRHRQQPGRIISISAPGGDGKRTDRNSKDQRSTGTSRHRRNPRYSDTGPSYELDYTLPEID